MTKKNTVSLTVPLKGLIQILIATGDPMTAIDLLDDTFEQPKLPVKVGNWIIESVDHFKKRVMLIRPGEKPGQSEFLSLSFAEWISYKE